MASSLKPAEAPTMALVFMTVLIGWIGFSLPYPVFSHLFLDRDGPLLPVAAPVETRTLLLGATMAVYPLGQIIGAPLFGRWSDRRGRKPALQAALLTALVGAALLAAGVSLGLLPLVFLGRFVAGLGEGNIAIVQSLAADVSSPASKARNFALIGIAMDLGFVFGPILGGLLADPALHPLFDFGFPFWAAAALFALNALTVPLLLREPGPAAAPAAASAPRKTLVPAIAPLLLLSFLTYWAIMIFFDFFPVFFVQRYGTPAAALGINAALLSVPLILSGLVVGRLVTRYGAGAIAVAALVLLLGGILLFVTGSTEASHILPAVIVAVGINLGQTATSVMTSDAAAEGEQGRAMGLYRAVTVAAGALAALVGGVCAALGPAAPFLTAVAAAGLGLLLFLLLARRPKSAAAAGRAS